jgi:hypothetical protein
MTTLRDDINKINQEPTYLSYTALSFSLKGLGHEIEFKHFGKKLLVLGIR